jgi:hypothetical protein
MSQKIILIFIFSFMILLISVLACTNTDFGLKCPNVEGANDAMQSDSEAYVDYNGDELRNVKIEKKDGIENYKCDSECEISCDTTCTINGQTHSGIEDYKQNADGSYKIGEVEFFSDRTKKIMEGKKVSGDEKNLDVKQAQTVENEGSTAIEVEEYTSTDNNFEVKEAKSVVTDDIIFSDIGESSFEYDESNNLEKATVISNKDNNTIVVLDTEIVLNENDKVIIEKIEGKLVLSIDSKNATVIDYENDVKLISLTNGSKYVNEANKDNKFSFVATDDISIQIITDADTLPNIGPDSVVMNLFTGTLTVNGMVDYQIPDIYNLTYISVIQSKSKNNGFQYNINEKILHFPSGYANFYSGPFEVKFEGNEIYYRTNLPIHPTYVINQINTNIFINNDGSLKRIVPNNIYFLYADNSESNTNFLTEFENLLP